MNRLIALFLVVWLGACDSGPDGPTLPPPPEFTITVSDPIEDLVVYRDEFKRLDLSSRFATSDGGAVSRYEARAEGDAVTASVELTTLVIRATQIGSATVIVSAWAGENESRDTVQVSVLDPCPDPSDFFPFTVGEQWTFDRTKETRTTGLVEREIGQTVWTFTDAVCRSESVELSVEARFSGDLYQADNPGGPFGYVRPVSAASTIRIVVSDSLAIGSTYTPILLRYPSTASDSVSTAEYVGGQQRTLTLVRNRGITRLGSYRGNTGSSFSDTIVRTD